MLDNSSRSLVQIYYTLFSCALQITWTWACCQMPVILTLKRLAWENGEFQAPLAPWWKFVSINNENKSGAVHTPIIPTPDRWNRGLEFKLTSHHKVSLKSACATRHLVSKQNKSKTPTLVPYIPLITLPSRVIERIVTEDSCIVNILGKLFDELV